MADSFHTESQLDVNGKIYHYASLPKAIEKGLKNAGHLPFSLKILLENLLRHEDGRIVKKTDIEAFETWLDKKTINHEIAFYPARVLMQDFTGVPAVVDLAAMRNAMKKMKGDVKKINPSCPVDLVIDHSIQVDKFGQSNAALENVDIEMIRNKERYSFLRWGQTAFENFRVVPPGTGICHQVNLEYLAKTVWSSEKNGKTYAYPDTLVGTDSHTTMINGLGVLGWGVGGIEAEAAMLGQPISMLIPDVIGFKLNGKLNEGITATDLVLTVTQMLRTKGVVGKFVEFFGPGLKELPLADRATIANMAPEYGATCGLFPIDQVTLDYLKLSGRDNDTIALVEAYAKAQKLWHDENTPEAFYTDTLELDLSSVEASLAGPKRPQDRVTLSSLQTATDDAIAAYNKSSELNQAFPAGNFDIHHGDVVIAAITSCTNTSNPSVMLAAGLVAKKANEKGLKVKPWVKTSLAPGSKVVTDYLNHAQLTKELEQLGFYLVGYGCTTCIGNSGPLPEEVSKAITANDLVACAVLSGNRNFEGRVHPLVKANWLASPPLVVAFALAGTTRIDLNKEPIGNNKNGEPVYLKDIWPTQHEIAKAVAKIDAKMFRQSYADVFSGDAEWQAINIPAGATYQWDEKSTYVKHPPFFEQMDAEPNGSSDVIDARILGLFADSITTDHISPAGAIKVDSPAGQYLKEHGVRPEDFNSYGSRRGNHEIMMRGTFANIRIKNEIVPGTEGGITKYYPTDEVMPIYDAAMKYIADQTPLVVIAGKEYGTGSSRDWAAKGTLLLGVKAVLAESFERIHRSNLIGMGVLPLEFKADINRKTLGLTGEETISIKGIADGIQPGMDVNVSIRKPNGETVDIVTLCRIDTQNEVEYYMNGGILQYKLRHM
ncbi:MAG: aconitate hydratase 1 [Gammaproteobacteria bacterium RIFCSPHIGHO2_12_FULL_41_15]|nr:MAG: aconitate hydratase 1 [Gammaproteobacteria bacterium RIFCSPHIGHO2_12_FULL_41_15]